MSHEPIGGRDEMLMLNLADRTALRGDSRVRLKIGDLEVWLCVAEVCGKKVRLGIDAPLEVVIHRESLLEEQERYRGPARR